MSIYLPIYLLANQLPHLSINASFFNSPHSLTHVAPTHPSFLSPYLPHSFHLLTHSPTLPPSTHQLTQTPPLHSPTYPFLLSPLYSPTHQLIHQPIYLLTHSSFHPTTHPPIRQTNRSEPGNICQQFLLHQ